MPAQGETAASAPEYLAGVWQACVLFSVGVCVCVYVLVEKTTAFTPASTEIDCCQGH